MSLLAVLFVLYMLSSLQEEAYKSPPVHKILVHWYRTHEERNPEAFYAIQFGFPVLIPIFWGAWWEVGITLVVCFLLWFFTWIGYILAHIETGE